MKTTQSGTSGHAIRIDDEFFRRLDRLIKEFTEVAIRIIAHENGVTPEYVVEIRKSMPASEHGLKREQINDYYRDKEILRKISYAVKTNFGIEYESDLKFQLEDIDQLARLLKDQNGITQELNIHLGSMGPISLHFYIRSDFGGTARYSVEGSKTEVAYFANECREILNACKPEYPFLHSSHFNWLMSFVLTSSAFVALYNMLQVQWSQNELACSPYRHMSF